MLFNTHENIISKYNQHYPSDRLVNQSMTKKARMHNGEKKVPLISGAGKAGELYIKE